MDGGGGVDGWNSAAKCSASARACGVGIRRTDLQVWAAISSGCSECERRRTFRAEEGVDAVELNRRRLILHRRSSPRPPLRVERRRRARLPRARTESLRDTATIRRLTRWITVVHQYIDRVIHRRHRDAGGIAFHASDGRQPRCPATRRLPRSDRVRSLSLPFDDGEHGDAGHPTRRPSAALAPDERFRRDAADETRRSRPPSFPPTIEILDRGHIVSARFRGAVVWD